MQGKKKTVFECQTCGRCGGSGRFSYNQIDGDRCFGCNGAGEVLTWRGQIARQWWIDQRTVRMADVKIGQRVYARGVGKFTVAYAGPDGAGSYKSADGEWVQMIALRSKEGPKGTLGICGRADTQIEILLPKEENDNLLARAIEMQNALTDADKPKSRRRR